MNLVQDWQVVLQAEAKERLAVDDGAGVVQIFDIFSRQVFNFREEGEVAKWSYATWAKHRIYRATEWPKPNTRTFDVQRWRDFIAARVPDNTSWYMDNTGWFDPLCASALDNFEALQDSGRAFVVVAARGHGGISGLKYPATVSPQYSCFPEMADLLNGKEPTDSTSTLVYFLMGDAHRTDGVGNHWRISNVWPVPNTPTAMHLYADGTLSLKKPTSSKSVLSWKYDPRNPAPSLGGHYQWRGDLSGPHDQRPLLERSDVLHFVSEPMEEPLAITGKIKANLFVETDVPDTTFVVKHRRCLSRRLRSHHPGRGRHASLSRRLGQNRTAR